MPEEVTNGTDDAASAPASATPDEQPDVMASDLFTTDAQPEATAAGDKGTPKAGNFDPSSVDIRTTKIEDIPEQHRPYFEPAYAALKQLESGATKRDQDLQDQLKQAETAEQEWRNRIEGLAQGPAVPDPQATALQSQIAEMTPEQKQGVDVVQQLIRSEMKQLSMLPESVQQLAAVVQQMQQGQQASQQQQIVQQVAEARTAHGDDVDNWANQIGALVAQTNPLTGANYTVRESYELLSGKTAQAAQSARQTDQQVRQHNKQNITSPTGTQVVTHEGQSDLSMADARAQIEALDGFE